MASKKFWPGMAVMVLAFSFVLSGCPTPDSGETDTWSDVTSLSQLDGTWKGSNSETQPLSEFLGDPTGESYGIKVTTITELTLTINSTTQKMSGSMELTIAFSGNSNNINLLWTQLRSTLEAMGTVDDSKHSVSMTESIPETPINNSDFTDLKINQNGTKVLIPAGTISPRAMIMSKQ
jgi:hypothetical protein